MDKAGPGPLPAHTYLICFKDHPTYSKLQSHHTAGTFHIKMVKHIGG